MRISDGISDVCSADLHIAVYTTSLLISQPQAELRRGQLQSPQAASREHRGRALKSIVSTSGILGYGFPEASLEAAMARQPDMIGVDGGSVDPGPHYLGSGKPFCSTLSIRRALRQIGRASCRERGGQSV